MVVTVHVDDCTITANRKKLIEELITSLHKSLKVTDLGELHWMLGVEIQCNCTSHTIPLSQHAYIDSILCCYNLSDLKPLSTPMDTSIHIVLDWVWWFLYHILVAYSVFFVLGIKSIRSF